MNGKTVDWVVAVVAVVVVAAEVGAEGLVEIQHDVVVEPVPDVQHSHYVAVDDVGDDADDDSAAVDVVAFHCSNHDNCYNLLPDACQHVDDRCSDDNRFVVADDVDVVVAGSMIVPPAAADSKIELLICCLGRSHCHVLVDMLGPVPVHCRHLLPHIHHTVSYS